jgi:hypothetical protein
MQRIMTWTLGLVVALAAGVAAHETTYKGTVVELRTATYAQPGGGARKVQELEVTVVDARTKKPSKRVFSIVDSTRLQRAGKPVTLANAAVQPGDAVEVVIDHDKAGDDALEVRLTAAR